MSRESIHPNEHAIADMLSAITVTGGTFLLVVILILLTLSALRTP
jgi:hypothetical protein